MAQVTLVERSGAVKLGQCKHHGHVVLPPLESPVLSGQVVEPCAINKILSPVVALLAFTLPSSVGPVRNRSSRLRDLDRLACEPSPLIRTSNVYRQFGARELPPLLPLGAPCNKHVKQQQADTHVMMTIKSTSTSKAGSAQSRPSGMINDTSGPFTFYSLPLPEELLPLDDAPASVKRSIEMLHAHDANSSVEPLHVRK